MTSTSRPRTPGIVFGAATLVLLIIVGLFAFTANQPPPPTIAEFAPQAVENITDAPTDQSSSSGKSGGAGAGAAAEVTPEPTPQPAPVSVPRVRKCVGDPPRQIEDPQSPPCVPFFVGDNGGATSRGVTRDEIRLGVSTKDYNADLHESLVTFFNKRFEFYGRKMRWIQVTSAGANAAQQRATAVAVDAKEVFAAQGTADGGGFEFSDELSRRKIISTTQQPQFTEVDLAKRSPYLWQYAMGAEEQFTNIGSWVCSRLAGRPASHAGTSSGVPMSSRTRTFGLILDYNSTEQNITWDPLVRQMAECGQKPAVLIKGPTENGGSSPDHRAQVGIKLRDADVTSVICLCHTNNAKQYGTVATNQTYFPEWIFGTYLIMDRNVWYTLTGPSADQRERAFGLTFQPRQFRLTDMPDYHAVREGKPEYVGAAADALNIFLYYRQMLLVASGVQMAGPKLTPETFRAALHRTTFPNPDDPLQEGKVGFVANGAPVHSMTRDGAEFWWSNTAANPYGGAGGSQPGSLCYVDGGVRHSVGNWPTSPDPFFAGACDSGA